MTSVDPLVAHLVEARKKAGLSQAKVAGAVGFSCATSGRLSEYETGRRQPSLATLRRWAQVLGFEPAWVELAYEPKIFYSHEEFDAYLASIPSTAPAVPEIAAGNGATPQDGRELSSVAPASDPIPVVCGDRADVAPKSPADAAATSGVLADGGSASSAASTANDPWAPCACGHLWLRHDFNEYRGDGSEMCCVEGCAQNGCPGKTVSLIDDALAEPCDCDAHNEIRRQMQDPEFAAAWLRTRLRQEAAARTLDVAERTVEMNQEARR